MEVEIIDLEKEDIRHVSVRQPNNIGPVHMTVHLNDGSFRRLEAATREELRHMVSETIWQAWLYSEDGGMPKDEKVPNFIQEIAIPLSELITVPAPAGC